MNTRKWLGVALSTALMGITAIGSAVTFNNPINGNDANQKVAVDALGNVYTVGTTFAGPVRNNDILVLCYTPGGALKWSQAIDSIGNGDDFGVDIVVTANGVYVLGQTDGITASQDFVLHWLSANTGARIASTFFDGPANGTDVPRGMFASSAGDIYTYGSAQYNVGGMNGVIGRYNSVLNQIGGDVYDNPSGGSDGIVKAFIDGSGQIQAMAQSQIGGISQIVILRESPALAPTMPPLLLPGQGGDVEPRDFEPNGLGVITVAGEIAVAPGIHDVYTATYAFNGGPMAFNVRNSVANRDDRVNDLEMDLAGNPVVVGYCVGANRDALIMNYGPALNAAGMIVFNGPANGNDEAISAALSGVDFFVTGRSQSAGGDFDTWLRQVTARGAAQWNLKSNFPGDDTPSQMKAANGFLYICGAAVAGPNGLDAFTTKIQPMIRGVIW